MITFELPPGIPSNNSYKRHYCTGEVNEAGVHIVSARLTPRAIQYKRDVGWIAKAAGVRMAERGVRLSVYIVVSEGWTWTTSRRWFSTP